MPNQPSSIADRLTVVQQGRFVGRRSEQELFYSALTADEPPFVVLHIYGPGGVGKTALLRQFERMAGENGRSPIRIDGRHLHPSPANFLLALNAVIGEPYSVIGHLTTDHRPPTTDYRLPTTDYRLPITANTVLFIDTYETITVLDTWLRETLLPQLPVQMLIVIAGRQKPAPAWHSDWGDLVRTISLRNLSPEDGRSYLATRNISHDQHDDVLNFTHGHPLALSLVADVLHQSDTPFAPGTDPDVVRILLDRFIHDIPDARHRLALEACAVAWSLSESLLAAVLGDEAAPEAFQWLRQLSFIEQGPYGLFPHDLARDVIEADLHWRNPQTYRHLQKKLLIGLYAQFKRSNSLGQQRSRLDLLYVNRRKPFLAPFFDWEAMDRAYAEPITPADAPLIVDMVRQYEGEASAGIAAHWLRRQPEAFQVCRTGSNEVIGFMTFLQSLLQQAVTSLNANPKDAKFHRALWHTYLEPAPTQERAAERLNLPFNTYRYHLSNGLERVTAWLWQKEVQ